MDALALLLKEDAVLTMPPAASWFQGPEAIARFFHHLCFLGQTEALPPPPHSCQPTARLRGLREGQ